MVFAIKKSILCGLVLYFGFIEYSSAGSKPVNRIDNDDAYLKACVGLSRDEFTDSAGKTTTCVTISNGGCAKEISVGVVPYEGGFRTATIAKSEEFCEPNSVGPTYAGTCRSGDTACTLARKQRMMAHRNKSKPDVINITASGVSCASDCSPVADLKLKIMNDKIYGLEALIGAREGLQGIKLNGTIYLRNWRGQMGFNETDRGAEITSRTVDNQISINVKHRYEYYNDYYKKSFPSDTYYTIKIDLNSPGSCSVNETYKMVFLDERPPITSSYRSTRCSRN